MSEPQTIDHRYRLAFGTGHLREKETCVNVVSSALKQGYRHIDTAQAYKNQKPIAEAVTQSAVSRESVFLATKIHSQYLGYEDVIDAVDASCEALDVKTIDLVYVHWPAHTYDPSETLAALATAQSSGTIQHIGLSNFTTELAMEANENTDASIFAIQIEMHPFLQQNELYEYARSDGIRLFAHTPLCQGQVLDHPILESIAKKTESTPAQVALAWLLQKKGVGVITGGDGTHLRENHAAQSVTLDAEDIQRIESIQTQKRCVDYEFAPWNNTENNEF